MPFYYVPQSGSTPVVLTSYVGSGGVANRANTSLGTASGVEASTYSGGSVGAGVGGDGVVQLLPKAS